MFIHLSLHSTDGEGNYFEEVKQSLSSFQNETSFSN